MDRIDEVIINWDYAREHYNTDHEWILVNVLQDISETLALIHDLMEREYEKKTSEEEREISQ